MGVVVGEAPPELGEDEPETDLLVVDEPELVVVDEPELVVVDEPEVAVEEVAAFVVEVVEVAPARGVNGLRAEPPPRWEEPLVVSATAWFEFACAWLTTIPEAPVAPGAGEVAGVGAGVAAVEPPPPSAA